MTRHLLRQRSQAIERAGDVDVDESMWAMSTDVRRVQGCGVEDRLCTEHLTIDASSPLSSRREW
jgi:hypothetical protein